MEIKIDNIIDILIIVIVVGAVNMLISSKDVNLIDFSFKNKCG
jgi:hypothetical protein